MPFLRFSNLKFFKSFTYYCSDSLNRIKGRITIQMGTYLVVKIMKFLYTSSSLLIVDVSLSYIIESGVWDTMKTDIYGSDFN